MPRSTTPTTVDPGFAEVLPYRSGATKRTTTTGSAPVTALATEPGGPGGDLVLPVSLPGAMLSFVLAMQVR